jgi:hypothetical protein
MNHKEKVKLARQLLTDEERYFKTGKFQSKGWEERRAEKRRQVELDEERAKTRAKDRLKAKK